jgi:SAM-dependent methyltransferase
MLALDISKLNFTPIECDLCGSKEFLTAQSAYFLGLKFQFVRCSQCELVYQNPLLSSDSREHLYETNEYWNHKQSGSDGKNFLNYYSYLEESEKRIKTDELRIKWVTSRLPRGSRILDLGCGDGLYVDLLRKAGYEAHGMDISSAMVIAAREKYGVKIIQADAEKQWPFHEPFDAIVCYTISNFVHPSRVFRQIQRNLQLGGHFFFNFPDCDNAISRLFRNRFYVYRPSVAIAYSKKTIKAYCNKNGLRIEKMKNDVQMIPLARAFGMLGFSSLLAGLKFLGLENLDIKTTIPTTFIACAVREE